MCRKRWEKEKEKEKEISGFKNLQKSPRKIAPNPPSPEFSPRSVPSRPGARPPGKPTLTSPGRRPELSFQLPLPTSR